MVCALCERYVCVLPDMNVLYNLCKNVSRFFERNFFWLENLRGDFFSKVPSRNICAADSFILRLFVKEKQLRRFSRRLQTRRAEPLEPFWRDGLGILRFRNDLLRAEHRDEVPRVPAHGRELRPYRLALRKIHNQRIRTMKILPFIFERTGTEACADVGENKRQRVLLPRKGQRVDPQPAAAQRFMAHALRYGLFAFVPTETDAAVGVGRQPFPAETDDVVGAGHKPAARVCLQPFPEHVLRLCLKAADDVGAAAQNTEKACEKAALVRRSRQYGVDDGNHLLRPEGSVRKPRPAASRRNRQPAVP